MKRWLKILWCLILLISLPIAAESLVTGNAYIISSINQDPSATIQPGQKYSLVPQIVVYDGTSQYVGSVTKFSGCYGTRRYIDGVDKGECFLGGNATTSAAGLMSASDKAKLDGIDVGSLIKYKNFGSNVFGADLTANQGSGIVVKDESTGTNWNIHMHGNQLRLWNGTNEKVLSESGHTHDDRYYTESEINTKLSNINVSSNYINSLGNKTAESGSTRLSTPGLSMQQAYNNGYPTTYGNVINLSGAGGGQILVGWSGTSGAHADTYIRSQRDVVGANWSGWAKVATSVNIVDLVYPVGAVYISTNSTSPATLFGGTWQQIQNVFLLSAGSSYSAGSTGGEASHTLTVNEMPKHTHSETTIQERCNKSWGYTGSDDVASCRVNSTTGSAGGGAAHNNMPPYLVVYMWKRTA